ncbi:recombinase family protein, partial [Oscillospiraceae bacterium OttesenSCG-928-G22]|nr:recombinase family protein [Oscillospiraceae bacterium OttesenSCG-928-G22]
MQAKTIHYIPPISQAATALRVAAYCRVSSDSDDQLESYANQVEHYQQLIGLNPNWELVDIYADEGLTGTRADTREDFQRLLKDCRRGRIDKVLVKSISRFARNIRDTLTSIRELKSLGVEVFFEKEKIDTGDMGSEMILSFYGAAAQEESMSISGNMRRSYKWRFQGGEFIACRAPYGYQMIDSGHMSVDEGEAPIVQRIFEEYLSGRSIQAIADSLAAEGIPKEGGHWSWKAVHCILTNERCTGNVLHQKRYHADEFPFRQVRNKGERSMFYLENSHPPIVDRKTFDLVQKLMRERNVESTRGEYPFSLMIRCGQCGATFKRRVTNGKPYWACRTHDRNKDHCPVGRIPEPVLEQAFLRLHHKLRLHRHDILSPMLEQLVTLRQRAAFRQERIVGIDNEILDIGRQTMLLHRLYGAGHMEAAHYYEQSQGLNSRVNTLRRERRRLIEDDRDDEAMEQTTLLADILGGGPERLTAFDPAIFREMVSRMTIPTQGQVRFTLINGLEVTEA